jgi:twitching motility protein PilT
MALTDLVFSDIFVARDAADCWTKMMPDSLEPQALPAECRGEVLELRALLERHGPSPDFKVDWNGMRMRVERMDTADGAIYVCRRYGVTPRRLADLGFPPLIAQRILSDDEKTGFKNGLVLFLGKTGSGKTTASAAYVIERLEQFGGVGWTVENPIEIAIQGRHGKGVCYQIEADNDHGFGEAIRRMLRASPNLIWIGEIRDESAAREAVYAATSGHLVVTTFHASDLITGLARFSRLVGDAGMLTDALRAALYLQLKNSGNGLSASIGDHELPGRVTMPKRVLSVDPLLIVGENADGLRSTLRDGSFQLLISEVGRQKRMFMGGGLP